MIMAPGSRENIQEMIQQMENSPALKKKFDEIILKKREEWNARKANRSLVG